MIDGTTDIAMAKRFEDWRKNEIIEKKWKSKKL
jgi:hypothetical protein